MTKLTKNKFISAGFILLIIFIFTGLGRAEEITFKDAIISGLKNNYDLQQIKQRITLLERELDLLRAQQDWQVSVEFSYNKTLGADDNQIVQDFQNVNENFGEGNVKIVIGKIFSSGLIFKPKITLIQDEFEPEFALNIVQPVLPLIPEENEKQYFKIEKELQKAKENLKYMKAMKVLSWLENYLKICRMVETKEIYQKSLNNAELNLNKTLAIQKIGEAGKDEVLAAKTNEKKARYFLMDIDHGIDEELRSLYIETGLQEKEELVFEPQSQFVKGLKQTIEKLAEEYMVQDNLILLVEKHYFELLESQIDIEVLEQELKWLRNEGRTGLNLSGSYDSKRGEFIAGVDLFWDLYDGGKRKIELEKKEMEIKSKLKEYEDLKEEIMLKIKQLVNSIELKKFALEKEIFNLEESQNKLKTAEKQFELGLIDYPDLQEFKIKQKEVEVEIRTLQDQLLIEMGKLVNIVNSEALIRGLLNNYD